MPVGISYADLTYRSANPLKRLVHANRFGVLLHKVPLGPTARVLDYGCGDGYFLRTISASGASAVGYEPDAHMRAEGVGLDISAMPPTPPDGGFTHIFCQEVAEHLPPATLDALFDAIDAAAVPDTCIVFTVPIEHGPAGAAKNMYRRFLGHQVVSWGEIGRSLIGASIARAVSDTDFGPYIFHHTGFDFRAMERRIGERFTIVASHNDPFPALPAVVNNSRIIVCRQRRDQAHGDLKSRTP